MMRPMTMTRVTAGGFIGILMVDERARRKKGRNGDTHKTFSVLSFIYGFIMSKA